MDEDRVGVEAIQALERDLPLDERTTTAPIIVV